MLDKPAKLLLPLIFLTVFLLPCAQAAPPACTQGWIFHQVSEYHGAMVLHLSLLGAKISSKNLTLVMPGKNIATIYNDANKTYTQLSKKIWMERYALHPRIGKITKGKSAMVAGHKATQYFADRLTPRGRKMLTMEFWTTTDLGLPKEFTDDCLSICELPPGVGMPLKIYWIYSDKQRNTILDTLDSKKTSIAASEFKPKAGYKRVNDEMDLIIADDANNDFASLLLDDPGTSRKTAPKARSAAPSSKASSFH